MNRHRARNGEINRKHGTTEIKIFRGIYGTTFALGFTQNAKLADTLMMLDESSLSKLVLDYEAGILEEKLKTANVAYIRGSKFSPH